MLMRLGNMNDWVRQSVKTLVKEWKGKCDINSDKAYSIQEFFDEHGGQKYVVAVIIQAVIEGVRDEKNG